jgi:hypothetical protein
MSSPFSSSMITEPASVWRRNVVVGEYNTVGSYRSSSSSIPPSPGSGTGSEVVRTGGREGKGRPIPRPRPERERERELTDEARRRDGWEDLVGDEGVDREDRDLSVDADTGEGE